MAIRASATAGDDESVLLPLKRPGTKTFADVPIEQRELSFESATGRRFLDILPAQVESCLLRAVLETGIESRDALQFLLTALSHDRCGRPISQLCQWLQDSPQHPHFLLTLYGEKECQTPLDRCCLLTPSVQAIESRQRHITAALPDLILSEREMLRMPASEPYRIFALGAAHSLDTIYMLGEQPHLRSLVRVTCFETDGTGLEYARCLAKRLAVDACFDFVPGALEVTHPDKAHILLLMGACGSLSSRACTLLLRYLKGFCRPNGLLLFDTLQERMLFADPIFDFVMWTFGWGVYFKAQDEPAKIVRTAGLLHEPQLDWSDAWGFNRITGARVQRPSRVVRLFHEALGLARTLL